jgi:hypothetical protein
MGERISTEQPIGIQTLTKRMFRRACEDVGIALSTIATGIHRSRTVVDRWADEQSDHAMPVWAMALPDAVSDSLFDRLVHDLRAMRSRSHNGLVPRAEGVAGLLLQRLGGAVSEIAEALSDGRISSLEAPKVLKRIAEVEEECRRLRASLDHVDNVRAIGAKAEVR